MMTMLWWLAEPSAPRDSAILKRLQRQMACWETSNMTILRCCGEAAGRAAVSGVASGAQNLTRSKSHSPIAVQSQRVSASFRLVQATLQL